jgi:hypothetical protein
MNKNHNVRIASNMHRGAVLQSTFLLRLCPALPDFMQQALLSLELLLARRHTWLKDSIAGIHL